MHESRRPCLPCLRLLLALVCVLGLGGCAYFNTFYNANRLFAEAERLRTAKGGSAEKAAAQYDACIKRCHDLLRYHPKSKYVDDALYMIGVSHFHRAEYVQAQGSLQDMLERFPDAKFAEGAWFHIGLAALALGDAGGAAAAFETLERNYPSSPYLVDAAYRTAEAIIGSKDHESMRQALRTFIDENPRSRHVGAAQLRIADTYYDDLHFDRSRAEYERALGLDLTEEQRFEAELQIALTKRDEAELILADPALYTEQNLPPGLRLQMQEALADSAADVAVMAAALPESLQVQRDRATALLDQAEQELERLRKRASKYNADLVLGIERAVTVALLGKPDEALADLDVIARTDPRSDTAAKAHYEMAEIHRRYGRWSKAQESYDAAQRGSATSEVAALAKKKSTAIRTRTAAMEQLREAPEARRRWRVVQGLEEPRAGEKDPRTGPDSVQAIVEIETRMEELAGHLLSVAELDLFDLEQPWLALRECQQLLADYPGSSAAARAALGIGWIYDQYLSDNQRAVAAYERVRRDYPNSPQARQAGEFIAALRHPGAAGDATPAPIDSTHTPADTMRVGPGGTGFLNADTLGNEPGATAASAWADTTVSVAADTSGTAPRDSTAQAPADASGTAPRDSTAQAPADSSGTAPGDSTAQAPADSSGTASRDSTRSP